MSTYPPQQQQQQIMAGGGMVPVNNLAAIVVQQQQQQQDKITRELFVGNTPPGTSELLILHFLNAAMRRVGLCDRYETPIVDSRVNNKFAFIELKTAELATLALSLNGIPFLGSFLKVSRPSKYTGPSPQHAAAALQQQPLRTWQQLTGQSLPDGAALDAEQEKLSRELFIGNTTPEMTEWMIREFLGNAMQQVGLATRPGNPISACRVSGKFAFVELRTAQEARNALHLNNIPFMGAALRVGRPSKWNGPPDPPGNWEDILAKYMAGELVVGGAAGGPAAAASQTTTTQQAQLQTVASTSQQQQLQQQAAAGTVPSFAQQPVVAAAQSITSPAAAAAPSFPPPPPSRVVQLNNMLKMDDLANDTEYFDILEDTKDECSQFGQLVSVVIPKLHEPGATKIFLEYQTTTDALKAIHGLEGRTFDGRRVQALYFDETKFRNKDYA